MLQEWTALAKMVFRLKPLQRNNPPTSRIRLTCYRAVHTKVCTPPLDLAHRGKFAAKAAKGHSRDQLSFQATS